MVRRTKAAEKPQPATPAGMEKVRVTKEFIQPIETSNGKQVIEVDAADVAEIADEPPLDRFEKFFNRVREEQGWRIVIYRLNSFHKDGRTDMRADKTYVGNIVFDPDTYLDDIQRMWPEGGTFKIQSKTPDNDWADQWTENVAPVRNPSSVGASQAHYFIQQGPQQPVVNEAPRDTLQDAIDVMTKVAKLQSLLPQPASQVQPAASPQVIVEPPPLQDKIVSSLVDLVVKTEKPETAAQLLSNYLNPKSDELSWKEIIGEVVKPLIPLAGAFITAVLQRQAQQQQAQQPNVAHPTQPQLAAPMQQQTPMVAVRHEATGELSRLPYGVTPPPGWVFVEPQGEVTQPGFTMPMMEVPQNAPAYGPTTSGVIAPTQPQTPLEQDEDEMAENDLLDSLVDMLQDSVNRAASDPSVIEAGRREIIEFKQRFPKLTGMIDLLTTQPPVFVIGLLSGMYPSVAPLVNNPVAVQVIEDLQAALKRPEQE